jgi:HAE1 family hydrophobic/amphiphilic exporter-1
MVDHQLKYNPIMQQNPNVTHNLQVVGLGYDNKGVTVLTLKPTSQRKLSADQVVYQLQPKVSAVPGIMAYLQNPPMIPSGSKATTSPYQFTLQSPNTGNLFKDAAAFTQKLSQIPELTGVTNDLKIDNPQVEIEIDRDKAATLGVSAYAIENALYSAYGERRVSTINAANDEYKVIMEVLPRFQHQASDLHNIYITANDGSLVNLDVVANYKQDRGPLTVNHTGQLPSVTVSFNTAPGVSLSQATAKVQGLAKTVLSPDISTQFEGTADDFKSAMSTMPFLLLLTVVIIYIILGVLYESFIHPITILSGLPSAALGGLLVLYFFGLELNLYGMVGVIMLIGIVQKNGIMVVDFALEEEQKGETSREAALNAALIRFRPILMTTLAAIMGAMPIAVGYGAGGRARQPLGLAVVGGLAVSQLVTLFVVPVVYTYMSDLQRWLTRKQKTDTTADAA